MHKASLVRSHEERRVLRRHAAFDTGVGNLGYGWMDCYEQDRAWLWQTLLEATSYMAPMYMQSNYSYRLLRIRPALNDPFSVPVNSQNNTSSGLERIAFIHDYIARSLQSQDVLDVARDETHGFLV